MNFRKVMVIMLCLVVLSLSFSCVSASDYSIEKNANKVYNNQPIHYVSVIKNSGILDNKPVSVEGFYADNEQLFYLFASNASEIANIPVSGINPDLTVGELFGINEFLMEDYLNKVKFSI